MRVSIEIYLMINLLMDTAILSIVARSYGTFRIRRILLAAAICTAYATLAACRPQPWSSPLIQIGLLIPISMLVSGNADIRLWSGAGLLLIGGAMLTAGAERLMPAHAAGASIWALLAGLFILALLLSIRKHRQTTWEVEIALAVNGRSARFRALIDTGNRLHEPLSGLPVLIAEETLVRDILPERGYRRVAFGALGGGGTLACFHPDRIWILRGKRRHPAPDVWVAISPEPLPGTARALAPGEFATFPQN